MVMGRLGHGHAGIVGIQGDLKPVDLTAGGDVIYWGGEALGRNWWGKWDSQVFALDMQHVRCWALSCDVKRPAGFEN